MPIVFKDTVPVTRNIDKCKLLSISSYENQYEIHKFKKPLPVEQLIIPKTNYKWQRYRQKKTKKHLKSKSIIAENSEIKEEIKNLEDKLNKKSHFDLNFLEFKNDVILLEDSMLISEESKMITIAKKF